MADSKDIAKVFYRLSLLEGNTKVIQEMLTLIIKDYDALLADKEATTDQISRWIIIANCAEALKRSLIDDNLG